MKNDAVVRARINEDIKNEAVAVLDSIGLSVSDAVRLLMTRIAREKALPFEPLVPNEQTIQAMRDARSNRVKSVNNLDELMTDLNANN